MADPPTDPRIARVLAALDAGRAVAISEREDNPGWHSYDHSYTLRAAAAGGYRLSDREVIDDPASVAVERHHDFGRDGLRRWLGTIPPAALDGACVALPAGKFELLAAHVLPGEVPPTDAPGEPRPPKRTPVRKKTP